jgi:AcrR family transcriptional regulator
VTTPPTAAPVLPRRDRLRAATELEIRRVARALLVRDGLPAVTLRAIAAEMGLTAPALYRYYDGHDEVLAAVTVDCFVELTAALEAARDENARDETAREGTARDGAPTDTRTAMLAICRAFRTWALAHPAEFGLVFANPMPSPQHPPDGPVHEAGLGLAGAFARGFVPLWEEQRFPVPDPATLDPGMRADLEAVAPMLGSLPEGAMFVFVATWARLVGVVSAEVFGQLSWATTHTGPVFEELLAELAARFSAPAEVPG